MTIESLSDYVPFDQLQLFLQNLPTPDWLPLPYQQHYSVGGSAFYGCPHKDQKIGNPFAMVRGSKFHEYYIPKIVQFAGLPSKLEYLYRVHIPCDRCKDGTFIFGGSIDVHVLDKNWIFDVKFPGREKSESEMFKDYGMQIAGYKYMVQNGECKNPYTNKWTPADDEIRSTTILAIDPLSFKIREYKIPFISDDIVIGLARDYHNARVHKVPCYRPNKYCKYCKRKYGCKNNRLLDERFMPIDINISI